MKKIILSFFLFVSLTAFAQKDILNISYGTHIQNTLDLFLPKNYSEATPVIIMIHGGAWMLGGKEYTDKTSKDLRDRDFIVANIDYRYVSETVDCDALLEDIDNAIKKTETLSYDYHYGKEGYHIAGISAGAHLSLLYSYTTSRKIKTVTALCAPTHLDNPTELAALKSKGLLQNVEYLTHAKYTTGQPPAAFTAVSPYAHIKNIPTLLIHGDADPLVPYSQSVFLYNLLQQKSIPSKLLTQKGKGHDAGMNDADTEKAALDAISQWIKKYN